MKKLYLCVLSVACLMAFSLPAFATDYPLSVEVLTDKAVYQTGENVFVTIQVKNESDFSIKIPGPVTDAVQIRLDLADDVFGISRNHAYTYIHAYHPSINLVTAKSISSLAHGEIALLAPASKYQPDELFIPVDPGVYFITVSLTLEVDGYLHDVQSRKVIHVTEQDSVKRINEMMRLRKR